MWDAIGHDKAVEILKRSIKQQQVSHAYLFVGPDGIGKARLAVGLAQALNCIGADVPCGKCAQCNRIRKGVHPDVQIVQVYDGRSRDGKSLTVIPIERVREVLREANLKPFEGRTRVYIFDAIHMVSDEGTNALLKTLEEPPEQVVFVLLSSREEWLKSTTRSRCQRVELRPVSWSILTEALEERFGLEHEQAVELARLSGGRPGKAIQLMKDPALREALDERLETIERLIRTGLEERFEYANDWAGRFSRERESMLSELDLWLEWWRDVLLASQGMQKSVVHLSRLEIITETAQTISLSQSVAAIGAISDAWRNLERNVNPRLALENLMLAIPLVR